MKYDNDRLGAALKMYLGTEPLPMHMPGHKRNTDVISDIFSRDITEISGFDNLHSPSGLLKDLEDAAAALWHKENAYCSVGGATAMILAAVCASAISNPGSDVLVAMNCHLSVWNALALAGSSVVPLMPSFDPQFPFSGPVTPAEIENILVRNPKIKTVIITSPTYEGVMSDTEQIYKITKRYDACLITDCAHGAHLGLDDAFFGPDAFGDIVIKSLHKTLNAPTQTAVMLTDKDCPVPAGVIMNFIDIFETTSPSYVLLGGISKCIASINKNTDIMKPWENGIRYAEDALSELRNYKLWKAPCRERSKLVILGDGIKLATNLRCDYNVECEAAFATHIIAMTGIGDTEDSIKRFCDAVIRLDELQDNYEDVSEKKFSPRPQPKFLTTVRDACLRGMTADEKPLEESCGLIAGEFLFAYPPGVPLLIPGEMITDQTIKFAKNAGSALYMNGRRSFDGKIKVLP